MNPNIFALFLISSAWFTGAFMLLVEGEFQAAIDFGGTGTVVLALGIFAREVGK